MIRAVVAGIAVLPALAFAITAARVWLIRQLQSEFREEERAVLLDWTPPVWLMVPGDYLRGLGYDELCNGVHDPVWVEGDDE